MARHEDDTPEMQHPADSGRRPSGADIPSVDLVGLVREILRGQRGLYAEVSDIKQRLERGASTLECVGEMRIEARDQRDKMVAMETKMAGLLWVAGVAGATGIGGLVTAVFALILRAPHT